MMGMGLPPAKAKDFGGSFRRLFGTLRPERPLILGVVVLAVISVVFSVIGPKIMGNAAKIHPVLVVFALIAGEHSYGLVGALFAVPVASIIQTIFVYYRRRPKAPIAGAPPPASSTPTLPTAI